MQVLIADKMPTDMVEALAALGTDVAYRPELTAAELPRAVAETEILIVRSKEVQAQVFAAAPQLALVVRAGAGVNTIDLDEASQRGVYVANCPGMNTAAVAELAIGLLIAVDRGLVAATLDLRRGAWTKAALAKRAAGLKGRTLGIIGCGEIGRAVIRRALALEMRIVAWSRSLTDEQAEEFGATRAATLESLAAASDAVSVHLALASETRHLIAVPFFAALRPGAIFINTSRGEIVDTAALEAAIGAKQLRVGLDVFEREPAGGAGSFEQTSLAERITGTPHLGASTEQAAAAIAAETVRIVREFLRTGQPPGAVNVAKRTPATHQLVVRHLNRVGVLAGVLDALRGEEINVERMTNTIFDGARAACCSLELDASPSPALLQSLAAVENILHVLLHASQADEA